ncbi:unnamed protein product [Caenorhabditis nigoni]
MSSWLASFFATLSYYLGYQPVDEQTLFVKEQGPETESEEIIDDMTMEKSDAKLVKKGKTLLGDLHTDLEKLNKDGRIWNQRAISSTDEEIRNEIQSNLTNLGLSNLMIVWKLTRGMVMLDNMKNREFSCSSKSKGYQQHLIESQERDQRLKEEEKQLEIEKQNFLKVADKSQKDYFQKISSTSENFVKKMNEQSHLGVRRSEGASYQQEDVEGNSSDIDFNPTDSRVSSKALNQLPIGKSFTTDQLREDEKRDAVEKMYKSLDTKSLVNLLIGSQKVVEHSTSGFSSELPKAILSTTQFEEQKSNLNNQHQFKMDRMKLESAENLKKSDMEFREKLAKEEEENEKELRELDREIEEFEKETKRIIEEKLMEIRKMNLAVFQCVLLQRKWEMEEKEFDKYLDCIREPISRLKTRYSLFKKVLKTLKRNKNQVLKRELTSLHGSTYYAYQSVYEGWENVKKLSETFSDRIFLFILLKTLVNVSDKLFNILSCIDYFMNDKRSLGIIKEEFSKLFSKLDTMDIPQTWKLRDQSEIEPLDTLNFKGSPRFYECPTNVRITEV